MILGIMGASNVRKHWNLSITGVSSVQNTTLSIMGGGGAKCSQTKWATDRQGERGTGVGAGFGVRLLCCAALCYVGPWYFRVLRGGHTWCNRRGRGRAMLPDAPEASECAGHSDASRMKDA